MAGEYRIVAVESGKIVRFRRYGLESLAKFLSNIFKGKFEEKVVVWDDVASLEMCNDNNLKLSISYKKLEKLHPADLADILEELDSKSRTKVLENLNEDLAADTLEEIDPEFQGSIIRELSQSKTAELLKIYQMMKLQIF